MFKRIVLAATVVLSLMWTGFAFAEPNMQEGMWEITMEMKIEGLPIALPPMKMKNSQCLTKKDMVPQKAEKNQECENTTLKTEGDTVTWTAVCKDKNGTTEAKGKVTYKGNRFDGTMNTITTDTKGNKSQTSSRLTGQRTGNCK